VTSDRPRRARRVGRAKRVLDVIGAVVGLTVLSPVLATIAIASLITQGRPILFRQRRPGLEGRPFTIVKFRTMRSPRRDEMSLEADGQRLTSLGRFLRSSSLDELPELWNVLNGEMSLVGPRPLLMEFLDRYTPAEARRHEVRPGVTGWAAVHGRHALRFEERLRLDVWYVDHWSLSLDLRIIAATVKQVLQRQGVSTVQSGEAMFLPERFRVQLSEEQWQGAHPQAMADGSAESPHVDGR
jgi:sugar transferase EpsL